MSDESERLVAEIPAELKRLVDADRRSNKDVVIAALQTEYGGVRDGAIDREIRENQNRAAQAYSEIEDRFAEIHEYARENHRLRKTKQGAKQRRKDLARELADNLRSTPTVDNPAVENYAEKADMTTEAFHKLLTDEMDQ